MPRDAVGADTYSLRASRPVYEALTQIKAQMSKDKGRQVYMSEVLEWLVEHRPPLWKGEGT